MIGKDVVFFRCFVLVATYFTLKIYAGSVLQVLCYSTLAQLSVVEEVLYRVLALIKGFDDTFKVD